MTHSGDPFQTSPSQTAQPGAIETQSSVTGSIDTIRPMVAEIRSKLASIAAREIALQKREQELTQQVAELEASARDAAAGELRDTRSRLEKRSDELNAQAIELATRAGRLQRAEAALAAREAALETKRQELERRNTELTARDQSELSRRNEHETAIEQRMQALRDKERELERRIVRARDEIVRERADLQDQALAAEKRTVELETRSATIATQDADLQRRIAALELDTGELEKRRAELDTSRRELERRQHQNQQLGQQLEQQRQILADRQRELEQRTQQARKQREKFLQQVDELKNQQTAIAEQHAALEQQARRLNVREQQLQAQAERFVQDGRALDDRERTLTERSDQLDARDGDLALRDAELQRARDELFTLRETVELRDAEARQATLAVELERQDLAQQRVLLDRAHEDLAQSRAELETRRSGELEELTSQREALRRAQSSIITAPRRWLLRTVVLSALAAVVAGPLVATLSPLRYAAEAPLTIQSSPDGVEQAAIRHAGQLSDVSRLRELLSERSDESSEDSKSIDGVISPGAVRVARDDARLSLIISGTAPDKLRTAAQTLLERYIARVDADRHVPNTARAAELNNDRDELSRRLTDVKRQITDAQALVALIPECDRDTVLEDTHSLDAQRQGSVERLTVARRELDDLLAGRQPEGVIDPAEVTTELANDVVYQEDTKELTEQVRRYRTELAVAMIAMIDPVSNLRTSAAELRTLITEQRELQPPTGVASALEALLTDVESFEKFAAELSNQWTQHRAALERDGTAQSAQVDLDTALVQLVDHQQKAADLGRSLQTHVDGLSRTLAEQIERLTNDSGGGTRAVVVAGLLRSQAATLAERAKAASEAAAAADPTSNFQLDACDRQLRGLRTRMQQRRDALRQQLQLEADRDAVASHAAAVERLRTEINTIESARENAIQTLAERLDELRQLDEQEARRGMLNKQLELLSAEQTRIQEQMKKVDATIAATNAQGGARDVLEAGAVTLHSEGVSEWQAGLFAFVVVFASCLLVMVRRPGTTPALPVSAAQ